MNNKNSSENPETSVLHYYLMVNNTAWNKIERNR